MVLGRRCREITESRPKNQLFLINEEDVCLLLIKGSFWKTSRGWVSQLDVVPYLFWYDPFYHGNFKFKAKLGLGTVLLTFSYHSDSKNGSCNKLFTNWVLVPYQEIQALGFPNSPRKLGLYEKPWACISWYGPCTQLVNSNNIMPLLRDMKRMSRDKSVDLTGVLSCRATLFECLRHNLLSLRQVQLACDVTSLIYCFLDP